MSSRKLRKLSSGTPVSYSLMCTVLASLLCLSSFVTFHTPLLSPSLSLDSFPLLVAKLNPHGNIMVGNLPLQAVVSQENVVLSSFSQKVNADHLLQAHPIEKETKITSSDTKNALARHASYNASNLGFTKVSSSTATEHASYNASALSTTEVDSSPIDANVGELSDLQDLSLVLGSEDRQKWIKMHWPAIQFLRADPISENFSRRLKLFFNPGNKHSCSTRFFLTWISPLQMFGPRERLCLESIFKSHPKACVVILSRTLDTNEGQKLLKPFLKLGFQVIAASPDVPFLLNGTPARPWLKELKKGKVDPGEISFSQNLSNILRLAALYKYGGIYLDSDVIVFKNFSSFRNVIGAQSEDSETGQWNRLNNAVMAFDKHHPLVFKFIEEFSLTYNGSKWGHNGPYMVTRVVRRVKDRPNHGCTVMPPRAFYPVTWRHISSFFHSPKDERDHRWQATKLMQLQADSYALHLWNKETHTLEVENGSIVDILFKQCCIFCEKILEASLRTQVMHANNTPSS